MALGIAWALAAVAQPVEHRIRNAGVVGSNPICGTTFPVVCVGDPWNGKSIACRREPWSRARSHRFLRCQLPPELGPIHRHGLAMIALIGQLKHFLGAFLELFRCRRIAGQTPPPL